MATVKKIKPDGTGDYTTLALWEDAVDGESSAAQWAECYSGGNLGSVNFSGWAATPTADNYPKIYAAEGNEHNADVTAGAYISSTAPIQTSVDYLRVDGLRIQCNSSSAKALNFLPSNTAKDSRVDNCIVHGDFQYGIYIGQAATGTTSVNYITNNIIIIDGSLNTTPSGMYLYGTDGSSGTTTIYVYNNTIYVDDASTLNNYGIRFINSASCTLDITVQNNIVIGAVTSSGGSVTYCYNQLAFNTGTKTFGYNISSDNTADDFGGTNNQLNERANNIWQDAASYNFNLKSNSVARNFGKTIAAVTSDIIRVSRPQPEGGSYDMGALEYYVKPEIKYGVTPTFSIPDSIVSSHEYITDALIEGPTGQECQLIYPVSKNSVCPNCVYNARQKRSANIYKAGGPIPFEDHTTCPWCGGEGRSDRAVKENIRLRVYWTQKDWLIFNPVENPSTSVMIIGYMYNLPKIEKADRIILNKSVEPYRKWICERQGEAVPWGLAQDRYFAQMLRRAGGG